MLGVVDVSTGEIVPVQDQATFADFWLLYPRRVAKKDAEKAWNRVSPADRIKCLVSMIEWRKVWQQKDTQYLPHPATWLNGERWEDEIPPEYTQSSASHVAAEIPAATPRSIIPDHVKAFLAKMRAKS